MSSAHRPEAMTRDERIRFIFLRERRFTRASAAEALGKSIRWVEKSRFERENGGWVSWREVVLMAYVVWTRVHIERALGDEVDLVFPQYARLVPLTVRVPSHLVIALRRRAKNQRGDVSEMVSGSISVSYDEAKVLERDFPGYIAAWHFPYPPYGAITQEIPASGRRAVKEPMARTTGHVGRTLAWSRRNAR